MEFKRKHIIVGSIIAVGLLGLYYYTKTSKATIRKSILGSDEFIVHGQGMYVSIPFLKNKEFYKTPQAEGLSKLKSLYKDSVSKVSELLGLPQPFIYSFMFIESGGKVNAVSSASAIGLMQITIPSATDIVTRAKNKGLLSDKTKSYMSSLFDNYSDVIKANMGDKIITKEQLLNKDINIFLGALYLMLLIDEETNYGTLRLDRVVIRYNAGYSKTIPEGDINTIITSNSIAKETKDYIIKLLGINGVFETSFKI